MALIELVSENIVKIPLESTDKPDVLRELVQILKDAGEIDDYDSVLRAVQDREDKQSTGLEDGIAVPHCKTDSVKSLKLAIGIAPRRESVSLMERFNVPRQATGFAGTNGEGRGIFVAGTAKGPMNILETVGDAGDTAWRVMRHLGV